MSGITAVNPFTLGQASPILPLNNAQGAQSNQAVQSTPGQVVFADTLTLSSEAIEAFKNASGTVDAPHHHRDQNLELLLLTYSNYQLNGNALGAVQVQQAGTPQAGTPAQAEAVPQVGGATSSGAAQV